MSEKPLGVTVVEKVAGREGVDATDLTPPLYSAVDPVALEDIVRSFEGNQPNERGTVRFLYAGYLVTVDRNGNVHLDGDGSATGISADR